MADFRVFLLLLLGAFSVCVESKYMIYDTAHGLVKGKLNVHLVAHTHDDVGWLKTIDQYYVGSNNSIQAACVQNVLDSTVQALLADKNRRFIYVEQAFFQRWWRDQSEATQAIVKRLVSSGQLEMINGGWRMHDEAAPHYIDMIDQTTYGHTFIKEQFNVTPRIGWQIDPFGHSAVQAYLLGAEVGFDSLFFGRIDYQDRAKRKGDKNLKLSGGPPRVLVHPHRYLLVLSPRIMNLHLVDSTLKSMMIHQYSRMTSICLTTMLKNELMILWLQHCHRQTLLAQIM